MNNALPNEQSLQLIRKHIQSCLKQLDEFQAILTGKRWDKIEHQIITYNEKMILLQQTTNALGPLPLEFEVDFKQLSQQHRRVSRLVYLSMQQIKEDLESIQTGTNRLKMILDFAQEHKK